MVVGEYGRSMKDDYKDITFLICILLGSFVIILATGIYIETNGFGTWQ
jgi:hypothetical protein